MKEMTFYGPKTIDRLKAEKGPVNYDVSGTDGSLECRVNAGKNARKIAMSIALAACEANPGVEYTIRRNRGHGPWGQPFIGWTYTEGDFAPKLTTKEKRKEKK